MKVKPCAARRVESKDCVGNSSVCLPRRRMNKLPYGLVEDEEILVLVNDRKGELFGDDRRNDWQLV